MSQRHRAKHKRRGGARAGGEYQKMLLDWGVREEDGVQRAKRLRVRCMECVHACILTLSLSRSHASVSLSLFLYFFLPLSLSQRQRIQQKRAGEVFVWSSASNYGPPSQIYEMSLSRHCSAVGNRGYWRGWTPVWRHCSAVSALGATGGRES